jgi:hypothetical protein
MLHKNNVPKSYVPLKYQIKYKYVNIVNSTTAVLGDIHTKHKSTDQVKCRDFKSSNNSYTR